MYRCKLWTLAFNSCCCCCCAQAWSIFIHSIHFSQGVQVRPCLKKPQNVIQMTAILPTTCVPRPSVSFSISVSKFNRVQTMHTQLLWASNACHESATTGSCTSGWEPRHLMCALADTTFTHTSTWTPQNSAAQYCDVMACYVGVRVLAGHGKSLRL